MKLKSPIYVLPNGIEVIGEYPPSDGNPYWRLRIRPHPFFPDVKVRYGGIYVRRSRVILASKLGRALEANEHAHHGDEDRNNDIAENIGVLSPSQHNKHHKLGSNHSKDSKEQISTSLRSAYADGRREKPQIKSRDSKGRISK